MKISVIIPVYNRDNSLRSAIESVFYQTYKNIELIVVNDGSEIDLEKILLPYKNRIKLLNHEKNLGVSAARNTGIKHSSSDYIAFLDSDDLWLPFKLSYQIKQMLNKNYLISHTDEFWWKKGQFVNQGKKHTKYGGKIFNNILDICRISPSSVIIHKKIFEDIGLFNENLKACEDYDLWLRIALKYEILFLPVKSIVKRSFLINHLSSEIKHLEFLRLLSLNKLMFKKNNFQYIELKNAYIELKNKFNIVSNGLSKK